MTDPVASPYDLDGKRVWVAGHRGMVGSALVRRLTAENCDIITVDHAEADLRRQDVVEDLLRQTHPQAVFVAAAKVGGIQANNDSPADFHYDNLTINTNIVHAAFGAGVEKLLVMGSSCIYPKMAAQPISEKALLTGALEPTNEWYATAKIAAIKMCQAYRRQYGCDFIAAMPTSLYGPGDNFDLEGGHVIPALMNKFHLAKESGAGDAEIWGTGKPLREFMHVDDAAGAMVHLMQVYSDESHVNIGTGAEVSIGGLAEKIAEVVGFKGNLLYLNDRPDGTPRKLLDSSLLRSMNWTPSIGLDEGLADMYRWYLDHFGYNAKN
jgi:GDP-L-fucose synthase